MADGSAGGAGSGRGDDLRESLPIVRLCDGESGQELLRTRGRHAQPPDRERDLMVSRALPGRHTSRLYGRDEHSDRADRRLGREAELFPEDLREPYAVARVGYGSAREQLMRPKLADALTNELCRGHLSKGHVAGGSGVVTSG
jgi:hypothetical protein